MGVPTMSIIVNDLNGDGRTDLVAASADGGLVTYLSKGCVP